MNTVVSVLIGVFMCGVSWLFNFSSSYVDFNLKNEWYAQPLWDGSILLSIVFLILGFIFIIRGFIFCNYDMWFSDKTTEGN